MSQLLSVLYASGSVTFSGSWSSKVLSPGALSTALGLMLQILFNKTSKLLKEYCEKSQTCTGRKNKSRESIREARLAQRQPGTGACLTCFAILYFRQTLKENGR